MISKTIFGVSYNNHSYLAPAIWQPPPSVSSQSTVLVDISTEDAEFRAVEEEMQSSIREHRDQVYT
jgi:hypothetical protein